MTTQEKINLIREKCIAANPDIMDLGFGCEVQMNGHNPEIGKFIGTFLNADYIQFPRFAIPQCINKKELPLFEILGRPIRLPDVLLAIQKEIDEISVGNDGRARILSYTYGSDDTRLYGYWNLIKDDLPDQSPECIDFLYQLLK